MKTLEAAFLRVVDSKSFQVTVWVAVSAVVTALLSAFLNDPKLIAYYGVINVLLVLIKEVSGH